MNEHTTTNSGQHRLEQYMMRGRQARSDAMWEWVTRLGGFIGRQLADRPARPASRSTPLARDGRAGDGALQAPLCVSCGS